MQLYAIPRRNGWANGAELEEAAARSAATGETMPDEVRWIRTYVLEESDGTLGTMCIYEGVSPEAVRRHAELSGLPADEVIPIGDTLVVNPDPAAAAPTA